MDWLGIVKSLRGLQTAASVAKALGVGKRTAVNYVSELRKLGYVKTSRGAGRVRMYDISDTKLVDKGGVNFYDFINQRSPVKVREPYEYIIHGRPSIEEALVRAIVTKDFRIVAAGLSLFKFAEDWPELLREAKKRSAERAVGALYDLARKYMRVRRMDKRTRNALLAAKTREKFIVPGMRSKEFGDVEKTWKIHIPFNRSDMERYRRFE